MVLLVLLGLCLTGGTVMFLTRAVTMPRQRVEASLHRITAYGFLASGAPDADIMNGPGSRGPLLRRFAETLGRRLDGELLLAQVDPASLRAAGLELSPAAFQGYRALLSLLLVSLILLEMAASSKATVLLWLMAIVCAAIGWALPPVVLRSRAQRRLNQIDRQLPDLIDLLTATVEAGMGFAGSLRMVGDRFEGALGHELRLTLQEQNMGLSTATALTNFATRCDTPSIRAFARTVIQGETLGVSIGSMMRNLAAESRKRRRQLVREQMLKAPVKMLFPLVFLIFPALFIVLLYPAGYELIHMLSGA